MPEALGRGGRAATSSCSRRPAEARGRFGFPGSFAEVRSRTADIASASTAAPAPPSRRDRSRAPRSRRPTIGCSPTSRTASRTCSRARSRRTSPPWPGWAEGWAQSGRKPVDGVMRFDPSSLARAAPHGPCPGGRGGRAPHGENLEQFLLVDQYVQYSDEQAPRREVLDEVAETTFERLETAELPPPSGLVDLFAPLVREGHLQIVISTRTSRRSTARPQRRVRRARSDCLVVTTVNSGGNKIDTFLDRSITYRGERRTRSAWTPPWRSRWATRPRPAASRTT